MSIQTDGTRNLLTVGRRLGLYLCLLAATTLSVELSAETAPGAIDTKVAQVLTPAQAGRLFLGNAANFVDKQTPTTNALAGRTLTADFAKGKFRVKHVFHKDSNTMSWQVLSGPESGQSGTVPYRAYPVRPGMTFIMTQPLNYESVALLIDDNTGSAMGFLGRHEQGSKPAEVSLKVLRGPILEAQGTGSTTPQRGAADLTGIRFTVVYPNDVAIYEHIYLNEHYVTWLGHKGTSAGVADTERYQAIKVAPQLYLVAWSEKSVPLQMSFLFDFASQRELAAVFGYDEVAGRHVYQITSAQIAEIMHTSMTAPE